MCCTEWGLTVVCCPLGTNFTAYSTTSNQRLKSRNYGITAVATDAHQNMDLILIPDQPNLSTSH
jgi:hypothetical protein